MQPEKPGFARVDPLRGRVPGGLQGRERRQSTTSVRGRSQALNCPPNRGSSTPRYPLPALVGSTAQDPPNLPRRGRGLLLFEPTADGRLRHPDQRAALRAYGERCGEPDGVLAAARQRREHSGHLSRRHPHYNGRDGSVSLGDRPSRHRHRSTRPPLPPGGRAEGLAQGKGLPASASAPSTHRNAADLLASSEDF